MVNVSAYPVQVDGRRLDDLAVGLETSSHTTGALRSADQPLVGVDGEVASLFDSREPGAFGLGMLVRGTDADGFVPASSDGTATYRRNLDGLRHLLLRTDSLLDVRRCMDKANSAILGTGGRTNLVQNPTWRAAAATTQEVRRNLYTNPRMRTTTGAAREVRRNLCVDPRLSVAGGGWSQVTVGTGPGGFGGTPTGNQCYSANTSAAPGETWTVSATLTAPAGSALTGSIMVGATTGAAFGTNPRGGTAFNIPAGTTQRVSDTFTIQAGADGVRVLFSGLNVSAGVIIDKVLMEKASRLQPYFDGSGSGAADGLTYSWLGTPWTTGSYAAGVAVAGVVSNGVPYQYTTPDGRTWVGASAGSFLYVSAVGTVGRYYAARFTVMGPPGATFTVAGTDNAVGSWTTTPTLVIPASGELVVTVPSTVAVSGATLNVGVGAGSTSGLFITDALVEEVLATGVQTFGPAFSGATAAADGLTYAWSGVADASQSVANGPVPAGATALTAYAPNMIGWVNGAAYRVLAKSAVGPGSIALYQSATPQPAITSGQYRTGRVKVRQVGGSGTVNLLMRLLVYAPSGAYLGALASGPNPATFPADGAATDVVMDQAQAPAPADGTSRFIAYASGTIPAGTVLEFREAIHEDGTVSRPYFDGTYAQSGWSGAADASTSIQDSADVRASCKVVDSVAPEDSPGDYGRLSVVLKVVHGFWRSATALNWSRSALASGQWMEVPSLEGSSAPINDAVVCLTGPANAGVQVWDAVTGTYVRLNQAIPAGQVWRVNAGTWESRLGAGLTVDSADTDGTDVSGTTDQSGTHPRLLRLYPQNVGGDRRVVRVAVVGGGFTSATSLAIKARRAHL